MSSEETTAERVPCTLESVVLRLKSLKRYDVGFGDDGDGYMYDYHDESPNGDWLEASDVDELIEWITQNIPLSVNKKG